MVNERVNMTQSEMIEFMRWLVKLMQEIENNSSIEFQPDHWAKVNYVARKWGVGPTLAEWARKEFGLENRYIADDGTLILKGMPMDYMASFIKEAIQAGFEFEPYDGISIRQKK